MTAPHLLASLAAAGPTTTTAKSSSGSSLSFLILLIAVAAFYFLVIRPRAQRQRQARAGGATLEVGARAMSVGGIKGTVVDIDGDDVQMEVSPGVVLTFTRRAVNAQAAPAGAPAEEVVDEPWGDQAPASYDEAPHDDIAFDDRSATSTGPSDPAHPGTGPSPAAGERPGAAGHQAGHDDEGQAGSGTEGG